MVDPIQATSASPAFSHLHDGRFTIEVYPEGRSCVVRATGELDFASRTMLFEASIDGNHPAMVIDLGAVTFMDCGGYGSLVASRHSLQQTGRTLKLRGATGQPARLLELIASSMATDIFGWSDRVGAEGLEPPTSSL